MKRIAIIYVAAIANLMMSPSAFALKVCDDARDKAKTAIIQQYQPVITEFEKREKELLDAKMDPTKFPYFDEKGKLQTVDLSATKKELQERRVKDEADVNAQIKADCDEKLKPMQDIANIAKAIATLGISEVIPKRMTNIDVSVILGGNPAGSKAALVPKAREDLLKSLGMSGKNNTAAVILRNPLQPKHWFK